MEAFAIPVGALLGSMVLFGLFVAVLGKNPLEVYALMYQGAFGSSFAWQNSLVRAAPLILTALCVAMPAQAGLMIIGGEGALVLGGLAAAVAGHLLGGMPPIVVKIAMAGFAVLVGGLWVSLAGRAGPIRGGEETAFQPLVAPHPIRLVNHVREGLAARSGPRHN